jgi:hypothetical protein
MTGRMCLMGWNVNLARSRAARLRDRHWLRARGAHVAMRSIAFMARALQNLCRATLVVGVICGVGGCGMSSIDPEVHGGLGDLVHSEVSVPGKDPVKACNYIDRPRAGWLTAPLPVPARLESTVRVTHRFERVDKEREGPHGVGTSREYWCSSEDLVMKQLLTLVPAPEKMQCLRLASNTAAAELLSVEAISAVPYGGGAPRGFQGYIVELKVHATGLVDYEWDKACLAGARTSGIVAHEVVEIE